VIKWIALLITIIGTIACYYLVPRPEPVTLYYHINTAPYKQCLLPVYYFISNKLPKENFKDVIDQFNYWNEVAKVHLKYEENMFVCGEETEETEETNFAKRKIISAITSVDVLDNSKSGSKAIVATKYGGLYTRQDALVRQVWFFI